MRDNAVGRRTFLKGSGIAVLSAAGALEPQAGRAQEPVPNSSGTAAPRLKAPAHACDCHMHVYDGERFPPPRPESRMQSNGRAADYRLLQKRIGTSRTVVVQPAAYGTDNRVTLDAIAQLGDARGVAVVHPTVTDAELKALAQGGIRGIRFTQFDPPPAVTTFDMIEPLAKRVNDLGWHVQIHMRGDQIVDAASLWDRLPCPIVFDHLGRSRPASTTRRLRSSGGCSTRAAPG
jgi:D-galactarolactone isomerase